MAARLRHIAISVPDPEKAAKFFEEAFDKRGERWPVMISVTITDQSGRTLSGQTIDAFWMSVAHAQPMPSRSFEGRTFPSHWARQPQAA